MKIAILGYGTVGSGTLEAAADAPGIEVKNILVRHDADRMPIMTEDYGLILADDEIEAVAECIGGIHPAYEYVKAALEHGKHVVTPNKNLISAYYEELMHCAASNGVTIRFTASAGGGIPWLCNLLRAKRCDSITEIFGIVNGTCNYILDSMHRNGSSFEDILHSAQDLGYAEADPSSDIEGTDTMRKCAISADLAFDTVLREEDIPVFGIDRITAEDISFFNSRGLTCKLMMNAGLSGKDMYAYVEPTLLDSSALEANVDVNNNMITLIGRNLGRLSLFGQGAGKMPTGTSVIQDIIDISETVTVKAVDHFEAKEFDVDNSTVQHRYYIRIGRDLKGFPFDLVGDQTESRDMLFLITRSISVSEAHMLAKEYADPGKPFFMAGIKERSHA